LVEVGSFLEELESPLVDVAVSLVDVAALSLVDVGAASLDDVVGSGLELIVMDGGSSSFVDAAARPGVTRGVSVALVDVAFSSLFVSATILTGVGLSPSMPVEEELALAVQGLSGLLVNGDSLDPPARIGAMTFAGEATYKTRHGGRRPGADRERARAGQGSPHVGEPRHGRPQARAGRPQSSPRAGGPRAPTTGRYARFASGQPRPRGRRAARKRADGDCAGVCRSAGTRPVPRTRARLNQCAQNTSVRATMAASKERGFGQQQAQKTGRGRLRAILHRARNGGDDSTRRSGVRSCQAAVEPTGAR